MKSLPSICAAFSIAVGAAVLVGWFFGIEPLKTVMPGFVAMKANTAFAFILAGVSLLLLAPMSANPSRARLGRLLALAVTLIGALTLGEEVFGWALGIDEFLVRDNDATRVFTSAPGRMAVSSTIAFSLLGLALLTLDWTWRRGIQFAELLVLLVFAMSAIAALEYAFGREFVHPFLDSTRMAVHTFITFFVLGVGVLSARLERGIVGTIRARMTGSLERWVYVALIVSFGAVLATGAASFFNAHDAVARADRVDRTHQARKQLGLLLSAHQDLQTGARGYAITGNEEFLDPYDMARESADRIFQDFAALERDDPTQRERLPLLETLHRERIELAEQIVATRQNAGAEAVTRLISRGRGERAMDALRDMLAQMDDDEIRLLRSRRAEEDASNARLNWTLAASTLLALFVLFFTGGVIHRDFGRRQRAEQIIREQNALLEQRVNERTSQLRDAEARLHTVFDSLAEGVAVSDLDGRLLQFNPAAVELHGFSDADEYLRLLPEFQNTFELSDLDGKVLPVEQWPLARILRGEKVRELQIRIRHKHNGWRRIFSYAGALARDADGRPLMAIVTMRDVTERKRDEQEIESQRAFLRQVIDLDRNFIFAKDREGRFTLANQAIAEAYGTTVKDLIGRSDHDFNPNREQVEHFRRDDLEVMDGLKDKFIPEEKITDASGAVRWLQTTKRPIVGPNGRADMILGVATDITERREAALRLETQMKRTEALREATPDPMVIVDDAGLIATVNARTEAEFGYSRAELLGQPVEMLIPQWLHAKHVAQRVPYQQNPHAHMMGAGRDLYAQRKDGSEFAVDVILSPLVTPEGTVIISSVRDVTARKQAEQKIRSQLEHLNLLDHITRATSERQDLKSIFQVVVRSLEENLPIDFGCVCLYDTAANTLTVTSVGAKSTVLAHAVAMDEQASIDIDRNGLSRCVQGELVYEPDIGTSRFPFPERLARASLRSLVLVPLKSESHVFGVLVVARREVNAFDSGECEFLRQLSEHVALAAHQAQLYGSLQEAYDELRETQAAAMQEERLRAMGQMASGIAHDINNALSPVSLYTESLLETEKNLSERARGYLETIQRAVDDVAETVARMREFYRKREQQLELAPVDVNQMVQQVLDLTKARWSDMPQQHGISIEARTDLAPVLPEIIGVESEIRDALVNLVFNAVDAMTEGGTLTLRTRVIGETEGTGAEAIAIEVIDEGVGMDEETRRRCLEPFFTTKGERGTGLGLPMVFGMAQRHSAEIEIDSTLGAGTTMRLVFAVQTGQIAELGQPAAALKVPKDLRLLLVDDDPILLKSLRDALESDGHVIIAANGGEAGIAAFRMALDRNEPFAAVFTDLGMPYVDGRKVAAAVKEASPATPVILLTGWGRRLLSEGDIPPHVDRILAKPPKLREVRETLAQLCATTSQETT